jgi:tetratricopeptide (TPR) repeat protein
MSAVDIGKSLVHEHAHDDALKRLLTEFQLTAADLLRQSQRIAEARDLARQVAAQCEDDYNRNPSDRSARKNLGVSLNIIGREHVVAGEPRAAQQAYERARDLLESLTVPDEYELANLFLTYALMSTCPAPGGPPATPEGRAARQALADRAVETLRRAIVAGYRDVTWFLTDVDFSELRTRDDFQALINDMVFPADPFAH